MWEEKSIQNLRQPLDPGTKRVYDHLVDIQCQLVDVALKQWRKQWSKTMSSTASRSSRGLYRDKALAYWLLGNVMNRNSTLSGTATPVSRNGSWILKVPRLVRKLTALVDEGQVGGATGDSIAITGGNLDAQLDNLREGLDESADEGGMDTLTLSCLMRRERSIVLPGTILGVG